MDTIGNIQPVSIPIQPLPAPALPSAPASTLPSSAPALPAQGGTVTTQAAEQQHVAAVQQAAQHIANIYVVSDQTFTIFKDVTGQYITRFTSLRDGKVTYIPEPTLYKLGGSNSNSPLLTIQA